MARLAIVHTVQRGDINSAHVCARTHFPDVLEQEQELVNGAAELKRRIERVATSAPAHVEPIRADDTPKEKPTVDIPKDLPVPTDTTTSEEKALPPAPEPVVLTGSTPSPQVALTSSEFVVPSIF